MAQQYEVTLVSTRPSSAAFTQCAFEVLQAPEPDEESWMERIRASCRGVQRRSRLLGGAANFVERAAGHIAGGGAWTSFLARQGIAAVVAASADGRRTVPALQAAVNLGKPAAALLSSWRDRSERPPVRLDVLASPSPAQAGTIGSLHLEAIGRAAPPSREAFCARLGLDASRPIVLYAAAEKDPEGRSRIADLLSALAAMGSNVQMLVRPNPRGMGDPALHRLARWPGAAILEPRWEWLPEQDWNCPLPDDLPWWRGALEHCAAAVSLPSTIALDFAAWGKPSVNLVWGPGAAAWAAPAYAAVRTYAPVAAAFHPSDAAAQLDRLARLEPNAPAPRPDAVEAAARLLTQALARAGSSRQRPAAVTEAVS